MTEQNTKTRTTPFRVKNKARLRQWAASKQLGVIEEKKDGRIHFALFNKEENSTEWPEAIYDKTEHLINAEFRHELGLLITPRTVVTFLATDSDKRLVYSGCVLAVGNKDNSTMMDFDEVLKTAASLGAK